MRFQTLGFLILLLLTFVISPFVSADPVLKNAFIFGSRNLTVEVPNAPGTNYTVVFHSGGSAVDSDAIEFDSTKGWGFEVIDPGNTDHGTFWRFGHLDDSPNNRNRFDDVLPEEIYDSFIGIKQPDMDCSTRVDGIDDKDSPCCPSIPVAEAIFRVNVENGFYRFVGAFGEADNVHASRILAEDGGEGPIPEGSCGPANNYVVLVHNHDQAQYTTGYQGDGEGVFARVGFEGRIPPEGNGVAPEPAFVNMDKDGKPTVCPPNSPVLEVTNGYIRIHLLQANANEGPGGGSKEKQDGSDIVELELWQVDSAEIQDQFSVNVDRSFETELGHNLYNPGEEVTVKLSASNVLAPTTIVDTFPAEMTMSDNGGGTVSDNTISFTLDADGEASYKLTAPDEGNLDFTGTITPSGAGCPGTVTGALTLIYYINPFPCIPEAEDQPPKLVNAFAFGSRNLTLPVYNDPSVNYTMVWHSGNDQAGIDSIGYTPEKGWGYEIIDPGATGHGGFDIYGPFDNTPNNRGQFSDDAAEQIYDSFIGGKDYPETCDAAAVGDMFTPCSEADPPIGPYGSIFKVDVPNGIYRFVCAVGDAENPHAHRVLAEDGGSGPPSEIGDNYVVLIKNYDQAQFNVGDTKPGPAAGSVPGAGVFGRVGFNCRIPPLGDYNGKEPQFVNMGEDGEVLGAGDDGIYSTPDDPPPESPTLTVTQGYIRFHLLQGNSNDGPGGKGFDPVTGIGGGDPNGTDMVTLELWKVGETEIPFQFIRGDTNGDGGIDISDAVTILGYLFGTAADSGKVNVPKCFDAADANDSGSIDLADAISVLGFLFGGDGPLPPPNVCGVDETQEDDDLDCVEYTCPQ